MNSSQYRVLVVDDDPGVCEAVKMALLRCNWRVVTCHNAIEALAVLKGSFFDLAIIDEMMPGSKGHELAACLEGFQPPLPVLMISAFPLKKVAATREILLKPFTAANLCQVASRLMGAEARLGGGDGLARPSEDLATIGA